MTNPKGGPGVPRKLWPVVEEAICVAYECGVSMRILAEQNGVSRSTIERILHPERRQKGIDYTKRIRHTKKARRATAQAEP